MKWFLGDEAFRKELLARVEARRGVAHDGQEGRESAVEKAGRLVREGLARLGWTEDELVVRCKGDPEKLTLATTLRMQTTMTLAWIATRLRMGTGAALSNLLSAQRRGGR